MYNKFRAVSSIQVILEFAIPLLASLGLYKYLKNEDYKNLNKALIIVIIPLIILLLFKSSISFSGPSDELYGVEILNKIIYERSYMYSYDVIRAMIFSGIIYFIL
jgi:hypothetical protein